jgi:hypothetical protein
MTHYIVTANDSDQPSAWMDLCAALRPANQDSGRCSYFVSTSNAAALEAALDNDDDVIAYEIVEG